MHSFVLLVLASARGVPTQKSAAQKAIEHVVVLVMENRPFDQFYGFAQPVLTGKIDGLTGEECFPTRATSPGQRWADPAEHLEFDGDDDDDDDGDDNDGDDGALKAADIPTWGLDPSHPLDGKTQILFNIFDKDTGVAEDKWVSFADSAVPPGESGDMKRACGRASSR